MSIKQNPRSFIELLSRKLQAFQASQDAFRVLCTLPHHSGDVAARQPNTAVKRLIILDSSFNPPTKAHAQMARSAVQSSEKSATRLLLLLAVNNADKAPQPASFPQRLAMMSGFGQDLLQDLQSDTIEIDVAVTTIPYFSTKSKVIGESEFYKSGTVGTAEPEQVFLAGFDTVIRIFNPKYYTNESTTAIEESTTPMKAALGPLFDRARLRITTRPDDEWGTLEEQEDYIKQLSEGKLDDVGGDRNWASKIDLVDGGDGVGVSSSKIRKAVKNGDRELLNTLVGTEVRSWIEDEELYRD